MKKLYSRQSFCILRCSSTSRTFKHNLQIVDFLSSIPLSKSILTIFPIARDLSFLFMFLTYGNKIVILQELKKAKKSKFRDINTPDGSLW